MDRHKFDLQIVSCGKSRLPYVRLAIVLWSADDTDIDQMFAFSETSLPFNPCVCAENDIRSTVPQELLH